MKIYFPKKILKNLHAIEKIFLEISDKKKDLYFVPLRNEIHIDHPKKINFVELFNYNEKNIKVIQWRIIYKNNICELLTYDFFFEAFAEPKVGTLENGCIRCKGKYDTSYIESNEILKRINLLKDHYENNQVIGNKNLIYYSVYFDTGYVDLLELSINSIIKTSIVNFDILIITDKKTKAMILKKDFVKKVNLHFLITATPKDGWQASEQKLSIFNFKKIKNYEKILYLDCDIICTSNISNIFNIDLHDGILYTAFDKRHSHYEFHKSPYYGFAFLDSNFIKEVTEKHQIPFNAGQFLFKNCSKMKNSFYKVNQLIGMWVGEYFFEQSFMNYYFCKNNLTNFKSLLSYISVINTDDTEIKDIKKYPLIHFSAPPVNPKKKIDFIKKYLNNV